MIVFTGDIHGDMTKIYNFVTFLRDSWREVPEAIVILGDVGANYYLNGRDRKFKKKLNRLGVDILCLHGNHEARPQTIDSYITEEYHGGNVMVEPEYPHLKFLIDGEIYNLDGLQTLAIGGAYSVDKFYRLENGWQWFNDEQPSEETKRIVERRLELNDWKVDQIISHTCPTKFIPTEMFIPGIDQSKVDTSTEEWLDKIEDKTEYQRWLCGHWHCDKNVTDKFTILFDSFIQ